MLNTKFIRENPEAFKKAAKTKRVSVDIDLLLKLDEEFRKVKGEVDELNRQRNEIAQQAGGGKPSAEAIEAGKKVKNDILTKEQELSEISEQLKLLLYAVPNIPMDDVPVGKDESDNKVIRSWGKIPKFDFKPKDHMELGEKLGIIDTARAAKVSGARFAYLKDGAALLEFALVRYLFDILTSEEQVKAIIAKTGLDISSKPFIPVVPPVMIRPDVFTRMARLSPEDKDERYYLQQDDMYLIGSAEHTLGSMHMDEIIPASELPIRYVGFSTSFRREAGSYGKDTHGILRVHQFDKVELESFTAPEDSLKEQELLVAIQEHLLQSLELPYQVVMVCTGDMGKPDARQIDIETWIPSQEKYRETHTADLMTDYQTRRLDTKIRRPDEHLVFAHTNDATAAAIGRMIIAILENYQTESGTIVIPEVLRPYMNGQSEIK